MTGNKDLIIGVLPNLLKEDSLGSPDGFSLKLDSEGYAGRVPSCLTQLSDDLDTVLPMRLWPERVRFAVVLGGRCITRCRPGTGV